METGEKLGHGAGRPFGGQLRMASEETRKGPPVALQRDPISLRACPSDHTGKATAKRVRLYTLNDGERSTKPPVKTVKVTEGKNGDLEVGFTLAVDTGPQGGGRGKICEHQSVRSIRRCCFAIRNMPAEHRQWMLTLTCADIPSGPEWIRRMKCLREAWRAMGGPSGIWFRETQRRGSIHLHAFVGEPRWKKIRNKRGRLVAIVFLRKLFRHWRRICRAGGGDAGFNGQSLERLLVPDGAARYAAKYACKAEQKHGPPDAGRWWGWLNFGTGPDLVADVHEFDSWQDAEAFCELKLSRKWSTFESSDGFVIPLAFQWLIPPDESPGFQQREVDL